MDNNGDSFFQPCMWSNPRSEDCSESPLQLSSVDCGIISGKVDLIEAFFNSSLAFHGAKTSELSEATDSMSSASAVEIPPCQAAPWISPELLKPERVTSWRSALSSQNRINLGEEEGGALTAVALSSCKNAPTNNYSRSPSSGESKNRVSCGSHRRAHQTQYLSNQLQDEPVSQGSSNPPVTRLGSSKTRLPVKRKDREHELTGEWHDLYCDVPQHVSSTAEGGFRIVFENNSKSNKKTRYHPTAESCEPDMEAIAQVKEMIYRAAALRPVSFGAVEAAERPRRRNVRISNDPQTVAARQRRERISERLRLLQRLVPGGRKMDTASMLDEAANYLRFLKSQVAALEALGPPMNSTSSSSSSSLPLPLPSDHFFLFPMQNFPPQTHALVLLQGQPSDGFPAPARAPYHEHL